MSTVVDLDALGSQGFVVFGNSASDRAGWSVSDAGDVNGDGLDDFIIGAPGANQDNRAAGTAYVIYGKRTGIDVTDLGNLQPADGFVIQGDASDDSFFGSSVSAAGDVNGDGFDDIIVGTNTYGFYGGYLKAYVIFGKASSPGTINLSNLAPSDGFVLAGNYVYGGSYATASVSAAGDINGDGFDDIIIGEPYPKAGAAYVVFGKASGWGFVDLAALSPSAGFAIRGKLGSETFFGWSVSSAGDVNGDGFDDLVIGAPQGGDTGEAYVIFGKATPFVTISLAELGASLGFVIKGLNADDLAGWSVSAAGDFNGDGFGDIVVGAPDADSVGARSGDAYVIFGKASGFATVDLSNLSTLAGFLIKGGATGDRAGWSVSAAGDVNGDGLGDLIVGAPWNDHGRGGAPGAIDSGEAYVIFGKSTAIGTIDLANLAPSDGFILQGSAANDQAGWSVSAAGDVDGDGFDDLIVGAPYNDQRGASAGAAYIISGRLNFTPDVRNDFNGDGRSDLLWRHDDGRMTDWLGKTNGGFLDNYGNAIAAVPTSWRVVGTGDFNGDGRDDILGRHDDGRITDWLANPDGGFLDNEGKALAGVPTSWHVAGTGDFNGDGRDDILWRHDDGRLTDWLGKTDGSFLHNYDKALVGVPTSWQVAATGDFNGDGRDDILWRHADGRITNWLGKTDGGFLDNYAHALAAIPASWQVAGTGDFNGDGRDDILWRHGDGRITNWLGAKNGGFVDNYSNGLASVPTAWQISAIGDFNGDGRDDILWRHDDGRIANWLGSADGRFVENYANSLAAVPNDWHVEANDIHLS